MDIKDVKANSQVIVKTPMRNNVPGTNLVRFGQVISVNAEKGTVLVGLTLDATRVTVPASQVETTQSRFGRAAVPVHPLRRSIGTVAR